MKTELPQEVNKEPALDAVAQERHAFEKWAAKKYPMAIQKHSLGAYSREMKQCAKEGWDAAIAHCAAICRAASQNDGSGFSSQPAKAMAARLAKEVSASNNTTTDVTGGSA